MIFESFQHFDYSFFSIENFAHFCTLRLNMNSLRETQGGKVTRILREEAKILYFRKEDPRLASGDTSVGFQNKRSARRERFRSGLDFKWRLHKEKRVDCFVLLPHEPDHVCRGSCHLGFILASRRQYLRSYAARVDAACLHTGEEFHVSFLSSLSQQ